MIHITVTLETVLPETILHIYIRRKQMESIQLKLLRTPQPLAGTECGELSITETIPRKTE